MSRLLTSERVAGRGTVFTPRIWRRVSLAATVVLAMPLGALSVVVQPALASTSYSVTTVPEEGFGPSGVAVDPATDTVYVANGDSPTVAVIDGATDTLTTTISVYDPYSDGVAVDPATDTVYVANANSSSYAGGISVIDGKTNKVTATIPLAGSPAGVAVDPSTDTVYVADYGNSSTLAVIDGATNTVTTSVPVGSGAAHVAVDPSTHTVYVTNSSSDTVSVIDGAKDIVTATIGVDSTPLGVAVDPSTDTVYVANANGNTVSVIAGATNTVTATVGTYSPHGVAVDPATHAVYVTNFFNNVASVIDGAKDTVTATIGVGAQPEGVAVDPATHTVYVADSSSNSVSVITASAVTSTSLATSGSPSDYGTPVTFTSTTLGRGDSGGTVTFHTGGVTIPGCEAVQLTMSGGQASCTDSELPVGRNTITATYSGDATSSTSQASVTQVVEQAPTTLSAAPAILQLNPPTPRLFTLAATLEVNGHGLAGQPVAFTAGSRALCTATTDSTGQATCDMLSDPPGLLAILQAQGYQASYTGDSDYLPSSAYAGLMG